MAEPTDPAARAFAEAVEAVVNRLVHVQTVTKSELQQVDERTGYRESVDERFLARDVLAVATPILLSAKDEERAVSRLTPAQIAEDMVTRGLWIALTGQLWQDGSDCDAAFWADCAAEAKRAIANLRPVPEAEALGPTVRKVPL